MRIFVTGASGFIGSAVVRELLDAGYRVLGLARSEASAASLADIGVQVHRGDLEDLESLRAGVGMSDGVIHTAFNHDFSTFLANCEMDRRAVETMGAALSGSDRPFLVTSGVGILSVDHVRTEWDRPAPGTPRAASEEAAHAAAAQGVRVSVLRHAPSVHGLGDHGFVPLLIDFAREKGVSAYVGEGDNLWPAVHRLDAARLHLLALEKGGARGSDGESARYHTVAEEGVPFREIAETIGRGLNVPVVGMSSEEAAGHFGWFMHFAAMNMPASSLRTREELGWEPRAIGLLEDIRANGYFDREGEASVVRG